MQNLLFINRKKILLLNADAVYLKTVSPDILLLTQSAKINLERVLQHLKPKQVVADGSNYRNKIAAWKKTCIKQNIPFHATAEKGCYTIK